MSKDQENLFSRLFRAAAKEKRVLERRIREMRSADNTRFLIAKGRKTVRELDTNSRQAVILQHRILLRLMKENEDTEYGRKHHFAEIHTVEEYKEKVPFSSYDDYEPYIRRMMDGEEGLISARPPRYYALTSGSIGTPKYIPVSGEELDKYAKYSAEMAFGVADEYYRNTTGKGVPVGPGLNAIEMRVKPTASGVKRGAISGTLMHSVKDFIPNLLTVPWEVVCPDGEMDMKYLKTRFALARRDLVFMDSAFMTNLVDLMDYIKDNYEMLCKDIYHGRINKEVKVPESVREILGKELKPDRQRARELLREFQDGFDEPIIPRIWPRMSWIGGIGTGGFFPYAKRMRKYSGKTIPFNNLCYAASESFMAVARHMGDESYVLLPDGGFYEFIPVRAENQDKTLNINELEVGEDYEIIVTNLSGFYRYRIKDVVRVTGYYNETPVIRFIYRKEQLISIAGEKTNEEDLRWAIDQFSIETGIGVSDYSLYADLSTSPGHYVLLMEPSELLEKDQIPTLRAVLERTLSQANPTYGEMVRTHVLGGLELMILQQQTYQLYRDMMAMKGVSSNQIKPVRLIETPFQENFFFHLREIFD